MQRRDFLMRTGLMLSAGALASARRSAAAAQTHSLDAGDWQTVREQFDLAPDLIQLTGFFLASHPKAVREAIERHRRGLDRDPATHYMSQHDELEARTLASAAAYLGVEPDEIALTDSTTMGLGLLYGGLALRQGQEILTTVHDHYATSASLRLRAERTGAIVRSIPLYKDTQTVTADEIVDALVNEVTANTRIVAVTWVHSGTGLKLPIHAIAEAMRSINAARSEDERVLLCVDGVHGLGVEDVTLPQLGCDFFIAGTHKWMHGPRGTGLVWGRPEAWTIANPIIPTFSGGAIGMWMKVVDDAPIAPGRFMTPGGFHSFEHRWAVGEAFSFHQRLGKARVQQRIHELNGRFRQELSRMKHVTLRTPLSDELAAGMVCFEVEGLSPRLVVQRLRENRIVASVTPYAVHYARIAAALYTMPDEVDATLAAIHAMA